MTELAAQLLESPKAPQIIQQVQAILVTERRNRQFFYKWRSDDMKAEFINGEIVVHSPALERHNAAVLRLGMLMNAFVDDREIGMVRIEKALVELSRNSYEPDIVFFANEKAALIIPDQLYYPAPDLIVEVLSKSTQQNDRGVKFEDYAAHGVTEYWLVDPVRETIETFSIDADTTEYAATGLFRVGQSVGSQVVAGFTIPVKAVFDAGANVIALRAILTA
ncbi:Uma2 family endonuclease [Spirosoma rhododendri]|uniref:Uma2 family endonuclease n=1 Tax=Spirosoma rhododendri TaxID=2728024 RepID=A0A7L5DMR7_9BACT|nr:Uma2 family endonuclease [Spirosoma rhododendri]QJD79696.1 Uma2 family endonuclease [Spirosoma rhododendri]